MLITYLEYGQTNYANYRPVFRAITRIGHLEEGLQHIVHILGGNICISYIEFAPEIRLKYELRISGQLGGQIAGKANVEVVKQMPNNIRMKRCVRQRGEVLPGAQIARAINVAAGAYK